MYEDWIAKIRQELKGLPDFPLGHPLLPHRETLGLQLQKSSPRWIISQTAEHGVQPVLDNGIQGLSMPAETFFKTDLSYVAWSGLTLHLSHCKEEDLPALQGAIVEDLLLEKGEFPLAHRPLGAAVSWVFREGPSGLAALLLEAERHAFQQQHGKVMLVLEAKENFYENLARLRAIKHLWRVLEEANGQTGTGRIGVFLPCTKADPYMELVSRTQMILSSAAGGAEWMQGELLPQLDPLTGLRLDAQLHHILHWESAVGEVDDPASGAYFLEELTRSFIQDIWTKFLDEHEKSTGC